MLTDFISKFGFSIDRYSKHSFDIFHIFLIWNGCNLRLEHATLFILVSKCSLCDLQWDKNNISNLTAPSFTRVGSHWFAWKVTFLNIEYFNKINSYVMTSCTLTASAWYQYHYHILLLLFINPCKFSNHLSWIDTCYFSSLPVHGIYHLSQLRVLQRFLHSVNKTPNPPFFR